MGELIFYCDGGSRGNPGPAASAFVVYDGVGELIQKQSLYLGIATNNVAEYQAILLATEWLVNNAGEKKPSKVTFYLDTELATKQLNGEYKVKSSHLAKYVLAIKEHQKTFSFPVNFQHVKRVKNAVADALVNETLDNHQSAR